MNTHISSGAIVYKIENNVIKILLLHRKDKNSWHLPKGTKNPDEMIEQTAIREVKEETGLNITLGDYIGKLNSTYVRNNNEINKQTHYFLVKSFDGNLNIHDNEHDEVCFIEYPTAISYLESFSLYEKEAEILKKAKSHFV